MAKHEAANMNLSKSMLELSNQLYYSSIPCPLENVIGLPQERAISLRGLQGCEPGVTRICFLKAHINAIYFSF